MKIESTANSSLLVLSLVFAIASCVQESDSLVYNTPAITFSANRNFREAATPDDTAIVGVAKINRLSDGSTEYLFNERQARYSVAPEHPDAAAILRLAEAALESKRPLRLISATPGTLITNLETPSAIETNIYLRQRRNDLKNPEPVRLFDFRGNDSLQFNTAAWQNWRVFKLCKKIIPDLATAKDIFIFCKQQTCTFGPTQIQPCIPFKYAVNGCFARAHKMRFIIEQRFGYCSEKVFSFGNLKVLASLSGNCCVEWWYHVAPVVRVNVNGLVLLYVIDPSMFTEPVPLLNWLFAQENTTCGVSADLTSFSIQPSSAYYPQGYPPNNTYGTDPNYTDTNTSLLYFAGLGETCNN
jgi:hypothetical protein